MTKQLAFGISAALTTLVVIIVWVVAIPGGSGGAGNQETKEEVASQPPVLPGKGFSQEPALNKVEELKQLNDVLLRREPVYQAELEEANRQLEEFVAGRVRGAIVNGGVIMCHRRGRAAAAVAV